MANTGNTQQQIDYGAAANDGQGDPLRTAFIKTDDNFDAIWATGPVGSNITIVNNTVQSNNTNGNIILRPNGVGVIQANAAIVPNATNLRDLGTVDQRFRAAYIGTGGMSVDGNVTVTGNLTAGNISYTGNVFVGDLQGSVYADDSTIMVDAVDNAMFADSATFAQANVSGNVSANYFIGNGSLLTGIASSYGNANVAEYLTSYSGNLSASNINAGNVLLANNISATTGSFSGDSRGENSIYAGVPLFTVLGSDVVAQFSANVDNYTQFNFQNGNSGTLASGDYVITADNGTDSTYFFNMGLGSSTHDDPDFFGDTSSPNDAYIYVVGADATGPGDTGPGNLIIGSTNGVIKFFVGNTAQANVVQTISTSGVTMAGNIIPSANATYSLGNATNYWSNLWVANNTIYIGGVPLGISAGNVLTVNGEAVLSNDSDSSITTTGNLAAGNILTDNYLYANGEPFVSSSTGNITFTNTTMSPPDGEDLFITAANSEVEITGLDFRVEVTDDVRIQGNNIVSIRNISAVDPITIRTDYNGNDYSWEFDATGNLTTPGNIEVSGDITAAGQITGTSSASTLVLAAEPNSNTAIQLNDTVDSIISTVANLEVRTDVANTPRTWRFDTTGDLTVPNYINFKDGTFIGDEGGAGTPVFRVDSPLGLGINLTTDSDITGNNYTWSFGIDGNLTAPGNISGNTAGYAIGYRDIPQVSFTGNATIATTDAGKHYYSTQSTDYILTIANNASQGFAVGAAISVVNQGTGNITIAQGSGVTLYLAGNATSGNRTLSTFGMATIMKVATDTWFINGTGVA